MGECVSKNSIVLTSKQIKFLQEKTGMSREEIDFFHREFIADHPDGYLTENEFIKIYQKLYNYSHPEQIAKLAFRLFDADKNGQITFDEFLLVSALARVHNRQTSNDSTSSKEEKSDDSQNYDPDGSMNRSEVEHALFALYEPFEGYDRHECRRVADQIMGANQRVTHAHFIRHIMSDEAVKDKYVVAEDDF